MLNTRDKFSNYNKMDIYPQHTNIAQGNGVLPCVSNRALWRIEPYFDGISTAVTTYKVVDQNGTLQYMGDRSQCEYFLQHGC